MSKDTNISIEDLIETAGLYLEEDALDFIFRAYEFAENAHKDQFRKSGEAYIVHPIQVAGILTNFRMDHERSEEHTSELQSRGHLVCRLLLEKKKNKTRSVAKN